MPGFGARLYNTLTLTKAVERQTRDIARRLVAGVDRGRLLDIGTGPGRLLLDIHRLRPGIELYGLDISGSMV